MNLDEVLRLPLDEAILLIRGQNPLRIKKMDYSQHPLANRLVERNINDYLPPWVREFRNGCQSDPVDAVLHECHYPGAGVQGNQDGDQKYGGRKGGGKQSETAKGNNSGRPFFPEACQLKPDLPLMAGATLTVTRSSHI